MSLIFAPLFSGSSGNALYVGTGAGGVLVDAGASGRNILAELNRAGVPQSQIRAILITHAHSDHVGGAGVLCRRLRVPVFATEGTWREMHQKVGAIPQEMQCRVRAGENFYLAGLDIMPFAIPHDAGEPVGYSFRAGRLKAAVATDLGRIESGWFDEIAGSDIVLLEANHDVEMLRAGPYPYDLKRRILSSRGHLSNDEAGLAAVKLAETGCRTVLLGHLSKENNFPDLAFQTVAMHLENAGWIVGRDVRLDVARRDGLSGVYRLEDDNAPV